MVCNSRRSDESKLLALALTEYRRALEIRAASDIVHDAPRDPELIRATDIEGLELAFELLKSAGRIRNG